MSLKENSDRELRKWCVEKVLEHRDELYKPLTDTAEELFRYIKFGLDGECDYCDDPDDGPGNAGPRMDFSQAYRHFKTKETPDNIYLELKPA